MNEYRGVVDFGDFVPFGDLVDATFGDLVPFGAFVDATFGDFVALADLGDLDPLL